MSPSFPDPYTGFDHDALAEFFDIYHLAVGWQSVEDVLFALRSPATLGREYDLWCQLGKPERPMKYPPTEPAAAAAYAAREALALWDLYVDLVRELRKGTGSASELIAAQPVETLVRLYRAETTAPRYGDRLECSDMADALSRGAWDHINGTQRRQPYVEDGPASIQDELAALAHPEPVA